MIVLLVIGVLTNITGCAGKSVTTKANNSNIAVITKSTTSTFFQLVFEGAKKAADEYQVEVTYEGPDYESDYSTQNELIEKAIKNEVGAIVISAIDKTKSIDLLEKAKDQGIYVIVIDSGIEEDLAAAKRETDNYEAGEMMAKVILENKEVYCGNIGLVNFDSYSENIINRERGFEDAIKDSEDAHIIGRVIVDSNIGTAKNRALEFIDEYPEVDTIVSFNEWTTLGVGYAIKERNLQNEIQVIGFDGNVISMEMLESGEIDGLLIQNPYEMGYLGVELACQLMEGESLEQKEITTGITYVTTENIDELDNYDIQFR